MSVEDNGSTGEIDIGMKVRLMIDKSGDWLVHIRHHIIVEAFLPIYIIHLLHLTL